MRLLRGLLGVFLIVCLGWTTPQSEESIGNLKFKLPKGWTKKPYRNEIELKPGDVKPSEWCTVTIKASLQANGDLVQWANKQADEFLRGRQVLMNTPIPYQDDPKGWEGCGLSFAVRVNANTPTYYHMFIGFRRGDVAGTLHFVTDRLDYTQKYQEPINQISGSLKPVNGFNGEPPTAPPGNTGITPPLTNPANPPVANPISPPANAASGTAAPYLPSELPPPTAKPSGNEKQEAETLADAILKGGPEGLAALERAALECGFSIHALPSKEVLHEPAAPEFNGMSFADIDLIGANDLEKSHATVTLGELQQSFRNLKALHTTDFIALWHASIDACRSSTRRPDRFYAALMAALGTRSEGRYSNFEGVLPESRIGGAQLFLLCWRSAGHTIAALKHKEEPRAAEHGPVESAQDQGVDALRDLRTTVDSFTHTDWNSVMKNMTDVGKLNPHLYMLAVARMQLLLSFITGTGELDDGGRPLVREKVKGKAGEPRNVNLYFRIVQNQQAWTKFTVALVACGYTLQDQAQKSMKLIVDLDCDKKALRNRGNGGGKFVGDTGAGSFQYDVQIEGAPQQRVLSSTPEQQLYNARAVAKVAIDSPQGQGSVLQAQREVWGEALLNDSWMAIQKQIPVSIRVQDWKGAGWQGTVTVSLKGSGDFKDEKNKASGYVTVNRLFVTETTFDYLTPTTLVTHSPVEQGAHTALPKLEPKGVYRVDDELFFEGDIGGCGRLMGSRMTTWRDRDPANPQEEQGVRRKPSVEIHPQLKLYSVSFFNAPPYLPATKRIVEKVKNVVKSNKVENVRLGFFDGVLLKDTDVVKNGNAVVNIINSEEEGELKGQARAAYAYTGFYQNKQTIVMATYDWELSNGGGQIGQSLRDEAGMGLALLQMGNFTARTLRGLTETERSSAGAESEEMATCYATKASVVDQLKHTTDQSRRARYRSTR